MDDILKALASGNLLTGPRFFDKNSDYGKAMQEISKLEHALEQSLSEPDRRLLERLEEAQLEVNTLSGTDRFLYGFRLGALMIIELFAGRDDLVI